MAPARVASPRIGAIRPTMNWRLGASVSTRPACAAPAPRLRVAPLPQHRAPCADKRAGDGLAEERDGFDARRAAIALCRVGVPRMDPQLWSSRQWASRATAIVTRCCPRNNRIKPLHALRKDPVMTPLLWIYPRRYRGLFNPIQSLPQQHFPSAGLRGNPELPGSSACS